MRHNTVRKETITQVLNSGDKKAVRWVFKNLKKSEIESAIKNPKKGAWFNKSLHYWSRILGVKPLKHSKAVLNINPS